MGRRPGELMEYEMSARILSASVLALLLAAPALAADYPDFFRPSYDTGWTNPDVPDPLDFEVGIRHWYSKGGQEFNIGSLSQEENDTSQSLELHFRIDDHSSQYYLKGMAGYGFHIEGDYSTNGGPTELVANGKLAYGGADLGYQPWGGEHMALGAFAGYQYWNDSPNTGRNDYAVLNSASDVNWSTTNPFYTIGGDSEANNLDVHALRLGLSGRAEITDFFDISGEVAAVPYAYVNGQLGYFGSDHGDVYVGNQMFMTSPMNVTGWGYGAMGEVMVGFKPTENMALRVGGRAWYLQGQTEGQYQTATVVGPTDGDGDGVYDAPSVSGQGYVSTQNNPFKMFRYGLLSELTVKF